MVCLDVLFGVFPHRFWVLFVVVCLLCCFCVLLILFCVLLLYCFICVVCFLVPLSCMCSIFVFLQGQTKNETKRKRASGTGAFCCLCCVVQLFVFLSWCAFVHFLYIFGLSVAFSGSWPVRRVLVFLGFSRFYLFLIERKLKGSIS